MSLGAYIKKLVNQPIGAMPVGLSVVIAGVKLGFERQLEIDGKVRIDIMSDRKKIVSVDGIPSNKSGQIKKLQTFIFANSTIINKYRTVKKPNRYRGGQLEDVSVMADEKDITPKIKKLIDNLSSEVKTFNSPFKRSTSVARRKPTKRSVPTTKKANPDKTGFLYRVTTSGIVSTPKSSLTKYTNSKYPNNKFFVGKLNGSWYVWELSTGLSTSMSYSKQSAIEETDRILNKVDTKTFNKEMKARSLPKEYLTLAMKPYKRSTTVKTKPTTTRTATKTARKTNAKKTTTKRAAKKVTPKRAAKKSTAKGNEGNLVYVGTGTKGTKKVYQYAYKKITKKK